MRIICQKCNKGKGCKLTNASFINKIYPGFSRIWIQKVCDVCKYVADEWEAPESIKIKFMEEEVFEEGEIQC